MVLTLMDGLILILQEDRAPIDLDICYAMWTVLRFVIQRLFLSMWTACWKIKRISVMVLILIVANYLIHSGLILNPNCSQTVVAEKSSFNIYNLHGEQIFNQRPYAPWNGKANGMGPTLDIDQYYWVMELTIQDGQDEFQIEQSGTVMIYHE